MSKYYKAEDIDSAIRKAHAEAESNKIGEAMFHLHCVVSDLPTLEVSEGNDCMLTMFGECSYNETGRGSCAVAEKIRKALSVEVSEDCISRQQAMDKVYKAYTRDDAINDIHELPPVIPTVSEDCISRYYVRLIESDEDAYYGDWNETYERGFSDAIDKVLNAPSVVPSRAEGEWVLSELQHQEDNDNGNYAYVCTNCKHTDIHAKTQEVPYCWWCGAKMKG